MRARTVVGALAVLAALGLAGLVWLGLLQLPSWGPRPQPLWTTAATSTIHMSAYRLDRPGEAALSLVNHGQRPVRIDSLSGLTLLSLHPRLPDLVVLRPGRQLAIDDADPRGCYITPAGPTPAVLAPGQRLVLAVSVLSLEHSRPEHLSGATLLVGDIDPLYAQLLSVVARVAPDATTEMIQLAVWSLSDGIGREDLSRDLSLRELFDVWFWLEQAGVEAWRLALFAGLDARAVGPGQLVVAGPLAARLWTLRRVSGGEPQPGFQLLEADLTVACRGDEAVTVALSRFSIRSDQGTELAPLWRGEFVPEVLLQPGESYRGRLLFEVPVSDRGWVLRHGNDRTYFQCRGE